MHEDIETAFIVDRSDEAEPFSQWALEGSFGRVTWWNGSGPPPGAGVRAVVIVLEPVLARHGIAVIDRVRDAADKCRIVCVSEPNPGIANDIERETDAWLRSTIDRSDFVTLINRYRRQIGYETVLDRYFQMLQLRVKSPVLSAELEEGIEELRGQLDQYHAAFDRSDFIAAFRSMRGAHGTDGRVGSLDPNTDRLGESFRN